MKEYDVEKVKELEKAVNLERLCNGLGMESNGADGYLCPFCEGEEFLLDRDERRYYCFDCAAKGDGITLLVDGWNLTIEEALDFLSVMYNIKIIDDEEVSEDICEYSKDCERTIKMLKDKATELEGKLAALRALTDK